MFSAWFLGNLDFSRSIGSEFDLWKFLLAKVYFVWISTVSKRFCLKVLEMAA